MASMPQENDLSRAANDSGSRIASDQELWGQVRNDDATALNALYHRHHIALWEYAISMTRRNDLAKDAVQEAFVYIWMKRHAIQLNGSLKAYLLISVRNHLLKSLQRQRRFVDSPISLQNGIPDNAFSPEDMLVIRESKEVSKHLIEKMIARIPARKREALYLKVYNNLPYKEVADIMQVSPQVARNYVSEAYQQLHLLLKNHKSVIF